MRVKRCVGAVIYNSQLEVFLMTSPKWKGYIVPGGEVNLGESDEQALYREISEELSIEISDLVIVGEKVKPPSEDFQDSAMEFHFIDYFARALSTDITPNHELDKYGWYSVEAALRLPLLDTTRQLVVMFSEYLQSILSQRG